MSRALCWKTQPQSTLALIVRFFYAALAASQRKQDVVRKQVVVFQNTQKLALKLPEFHRKKYTNQLITPQPHNRNIKFNLK